MLKNRRHVPEFNIYPRSKTIANSKKVHKLKKMFTVSENVQKCNHDSNNVHEFRKMSMHSICSWFKKVFLVNVYLLKFC